MTEELLKNHRLSLYEEKIQSLNRTLQTLNPSILLPSKAFQIGFPLDSDHQEQYRKSFESKVNMIPDLNPVPTYKSSFESELNFSLLTTESLQSHLNSFISSNYNNLSYQHLKLLKVFPRTQKTNEDIEDLVKHLKFCETSLASLSLSDSNSSPLNLSIITSCFDSLLSQKNSLKTYHKIHYRIKWSVIASQTEIWKKYADSLRQLKELSVKRMTLLTSDASIGKVKLKVKIVTNINAKNLERQKEMMKKVHAQHSTFAEEHLNINDEILNSHYSDFDLPPVLLNNNNQLNALLENICKEFGLINTLPDDDGHTIATQINDMLPQIFEVQKQRMEFVSYGDLVHKDKVRKKFQRLPQRGIFRLNSMGGQEESTRVSYKTVCVKDPDWTEVNKILDKVGVNTDEKRQEARLRSTIKNDTLLENAFNILNIQNLTALLKLLEEFAMTYPEKSSKKGTLRNDLAESEEIIKQAYLKNLLLDKTSSQMSEPEPISISSSNLKSLYALKLLKSRELKYKLLQTLNILRSIERRLSLDIENLSTLSKGDKKNQESSPDVLEFNDGEFFVKDSKNEYIIYSSVFEDYDKLVKWLVRLGTFYIEKHEVLLSHNTRQYPPIDRDFLMAELLEEEAAFQESKMWLLEGLLKIYENTSNSHDAFSLAIYMIKIIQMRPLINLGNSYFAQSYWAHIQSLTRHKEFIARYFSAFQRGSSFEHCMDRILDLTGIIENHLEDLCLEFDVVCPKSKHLIESLLYQTSISEINEAINSNTKCINIDWPAVKSLFIRSWEEIIKGKLKTSSGNQLSLEILSTNLLNFAKLVLKIQRKQLESQVLTEIHTRQLFIWKQTQSDSTAAGQKFSYSIMELDSQYFSMLNFGNESSLTSVLTGYTIPMLTSAAKYEIFSRQLLEICIRTNHINSYESLRQIAEIEVARDKAFIMKDSKINWMLILSRKGKGVNHEKVETEKKRLLSKIENNGSVCNPWDVKKNKKAEIMKEGGLSDLETVQRFYEGVLVKIYDDCLCLQAIKVLKEIKKVGKCVSEAGFKKAVAERVMKIDFQGLESFNLSSIETLETFLVENMLGKWNNPVNFDLAKFLLEVIGLLRYTQISIFFSLLKIPSNKVLEHFEGITREKRIDSDDILIENTEEPQLNEESLIIIDSFKRINSKVNPHWSKLCSGIYYGLSIVVYELMNKLLLEGNDFEARALNEMMEDLKGQKEVSLGYKDSVRNSIIYVIEDYFHDNAVKTHQRSHLAGAYLKTLDWGFIEVSAENRFFAWETGKKYETLNNTQEFKNKLKLHRLKVLFIKYQECKSSYSINYSDSLQLLNDFMPKSADLQEAADDQMQIKILTDYFLEELCIFGISELEKKLESYDGVDILPSSHKFTCNFDHSISDSTSKIGCFHSYFNILRNHSSCVETPTSGYALVFFLKDFTMFTRRFTQQYLLFNEVGHNFQIEGLNLRIQFLQSQLLLKNQEAEYYKDEANKIESHFDEIVNSTLTQKGSEIIYSLDSLHRQLREIKENTRLLEKYVRVVINKEFKERIDTKEREINDIITNYKSFQQELAQNVQKELENHVSEGITQVAPYSSKIKRKKITDLLEDTRDYVKTRRLKEKRKITGQMTLLRIFNKWALLKNQSKIDKEIKFLKSQLASNQFIWEELNHTQRRETILKQDLANSQNTLATSEKLVEKLQQDIEEINTERLQLQLYKESKGKQAEQLEDFVKEEKSTINNMKFMSECADKRNKLVNLQEKEMKAGEEYIGKHLEYQEEIKKLKETLKSVREKKLEAFENLALLRDEVEGRNKNGNWKEKYLSLQKSLSKSLSKSTNSGVSQLSKSPESFDKIGNFFPQISKDKRGGFK